MYCAGAADSYRESSGLRRVTREARNRGLSRMVSGSVGEGWFLVRVALVFRLRLIQKCGDPRRAWPMGRGRSKFCWRDGWAASAAIDSQSPQPTFAFCFLGEAFASSVGRYPAGWRVRPWLRMNKLTLEYPFIARIVLFHIVNSITRGAVLELIGVSVDVFRSGCLPHPRAKGHTRPHKQFCVNPRKRQGTSFHLSPFRC